MTLPTPLEVSGTELEKGKLCPALAALEEFPEAQPELVEGEEGIYCSESLVSFTADKNNLRALPQH